MVRYQLEMGCYETRCTSTRICDKGKGLRLEDGCEFIEQMVLLLLLAYGICGC